MKYRIEHRPDLKSLKFMLYRRTGRRQTDEELIGYLLDDEVAIAVRDFLNQADPVIPHLPPRGGDDKV